MHRPVDGTSQLAELFCLNREKEITISGFRRYELPYGVHASCVALLVIVVYDGSLLCLILRGGGEACTCLPAMLSSYEDCYHRSKNPTWGLFECYGFVEKIF